MEKSDYRNLSRPDAPQIELPNISSTSVSCAATAAAVQAYYESLMRPGAPTFPGSCFMVFVR